MMMWLKFVIPELESQKKQKGGSLGSLASQFSLTGELQANGDPASKTVGVMAPNGT